jgi:hypothetical protein
VRERVLTRPGLDPDAPAHFTAPSRRVPLLPEVAWASGVPTSVASASKAKSARMRRIRSKAPA